MQGSQDITGMSDTGMSGAPKRRSIEARRRAGTAVVIRLVVGLAAVLGAEGRGLRGQSAERRAGSLEWKLAAGESQRVTFRQTTDSLTTVNRLVSRARIVMEADLTWRVDSAESDGRMRITQTLDRLAMRLTPSGDEKPVAYDSASNEPPRGAARDIAETVRPLIGLTTRFTMTRLGEILDAALTEESLKSLGEIGDRSNLIEIFSAEGLTESFRQAMPRLPETPPQVGATWNGSTRTALATGKLVQDNTYTYTGPSEGQTNLAEIGLQSRLTWEPAKEPAGPAIAITDQKATGAIRFDTDRGRFRNAWIEQSLTTETPYRNDVVRVRLDTRLELELP